MPIKIRLLIASLLALLVSACASSVGSPYSKLTLPPVSNPLSSSSNQILITFEDERNQRVPIADPVNGYRQRSSYGNSTWSKRVAEALADDYGLHQVTQWPINSLGIHCVVYEIPVNQSMEQILKRLEKDKRIEAVQTMKAFHVMGETYTDPYFKLQTGIRDMHVEPAHHIATGRNVKIAVIDTGVDDKHPDLAGQIALSQNFVEEPNNGLDDIHGTAVAGIIAATANNQMGIVGMAPNAKIIALKACWQVEPKKAEADCNSLTLALALNTAINLKPEIINLSLVGTEDPLVKRLVSKAVDDGIIVVASAPSADMGKSDFPASVKGVIAVRTANAKVNPELLVGGSIPAPGMEILTTLPHGSYNFMSGSSFAAAHISGLIALLLELKPHLSAEFILSGLQASMSHSSALQTVDACVAVADFGKLPDCNKQIINTAPGLLASPSQL